MSGPRKGQAPPAAEERYEAAMHLLARGAMRSGQLAEALGCAPTNIDYVMKRAEAAGAVVHCEVAVPGSPPQNEWRLSAAGTPKPWREFSVRRNGWATPSRSAARAAPPKVQPNTAKSIPRDIPAAAAPAAPASAVAAPPAEPPLSATDQPAVSVPNNAGSAPDAPAGPSSRAGEAGRASLPSSARDVAGVGASGRSPLLRFAITHDGAIYIGGAELAELTPKQTRALGEFMRQVEALWREP